MPAREILEAVLWILDTGAQWDTLPQSFPNYKTVHRRFQPWCLQDVLRTFLTDLANPLREEGVIDERERFIDATFAFAKGGGDEIGPTKRGKGVKILAIADRHGLPLSVSTHAANHHEVTLVQLSFDFCVLEAEPGHLMGGRAYDSDRPNANLAAEGESDCADRKNRKTQDGRPLRRYARRWRVERFFAWMQWKRRLLACWEFYERTSWGFVQLAAMTVLLRRI